MQTRTLLAWFWSEILSVALVGTAGMLLFELAWVALRLGSAPPRAFLLFAGVLFCSLIHPRLCRRRRLVRV